MIKMDEKNNNKDVESGSTSGKGPQSVSHWRLVIDQALITPEVQNWNYNGSGTDEDPYVSTKGLSYLLIYSLLTLRRW